jgi:hypothetical protein
MAWVGRHRGLAVGAGLALAVVLALGWYVNRDVPQTLLSYWVIDDRTIGVQAINGRNATCWLASTAERPTEVRVDVECHPLIQLVGSTAAGYPYNFTVTLGAVLGDRRVVDALANEAVMCVAPRCGIPG